MGAVGLEVALSLVSATGTGLSGFLLWKLKQNSLRVKGTNYAMVMLIRAEIRRQYVTAKGRGWVSFDEAQDIVDLGKAYAALGGNGTGDAMVKELIGMDKRNP